MADETSRVDGVTPPVVTMIARWLPASYDYPCYLWCEDGEWQWSIPELKIRGWGFATKDDAKQHVADWLRLPANRGAVWVDGPEGGRPMYSLDEED